MIEKPQSNGSFTHVEAWVFDLDNTLYPADCNLFAEIDRRMGTFIAERFGLPFATAQALRKRYYYEYGTTLAGLMRTRRGADRNAATGRVDEPPGLPLPRRHLRTVHRHHVSVRKPLPLHGVAYRTPIRGTTRDALGAR